MSDEDLDAFVKQLIRAALDAGELARQDKLYSELMMAHVAAQGVRFAYEHLKESKMANARRSKAAQNLRSALRAWMDEYNRPPGPSPFTQALDRTLAKPNVKD